MNWFQSIIEQTQQYLLGIMLILNTLTRLILEYLIFFPFFSVAIEMHFQIGISFLCIHKKLIPIFRFRVNFLGQIFVVVPMWYFVGVCHNLLVDMVFININNNNFIVCRFWLTYPSWNLNDLNEKICIKKNFCKHSFKLLM